MLLLLSILTAVALATRMPAQGGTDRDWTLSQCKRDEDGKCTNGGQMSEKMCDKTKGKQYSDSCYHCMYGFKRPIFNLNDYCCTYNDYIINRNADPSTRCYCMDWDDCKPENGECQCNGHKNGAGRGGPDCDSTLGDGTPWCYVGSNRQCTDKKGSGVKWSTQACKLAGERKCWVRMPTGCSRTLSETETPTEWFVDSTAEDNGCGTWRRSFVNQYCKREDAELYWGLTPPAATTPAAEQECECSGHKNGAGRGGPDCDSTLGDGTAWCYVGNNPKCTDKQGSGVKWSTQACASTQAEQECECSGYKNGAGRGGPDCDSTLGDGTPWCYVGNNPKCTDKKGSGVKWSTEACGSTQSAENAVGQGQVYLETQVVPSAANSAPIVNGFAALGLAFLLFGAYKHYVGKE